MLDEGYVKLVHLAEVISLCLILRGTLLLSCALPLSATYRQQTISLSD